MYRIEAAGLEKHKLSPYAQLMQGNAGEGFQTLNSNFYDTAISAEASQVGGHLSMAVGKTGGHRKIRALDSFVSYSNTGPSRGSHVIYKHF